MEKVKLPRRVAEALEEAKGSYGGDIDMISWNIPREDRGDVWFWNVLYEFSLNDGGFLKLIDALRYGYDIEPKPITVTITPEMQDELRKVYNDCPFNEKVGFRSALTVLDLKIPGVNA